MELAWATATRQGLVDAQAEADLAHRQAETRDLEAKIARESRREVAEIAFLEAQTTKLTGEFAQQPLEAEERRARIEETEARTARIWLMVFLPPFLVALGLILGSVDSGALASSGYDLIGSKIWMLPKLAEGG